MTENCSCSLARSIIEAVAGAGATRRSRREQSSTVLAAVILGGTSIYGSSGVLRVLLLRVVFMTMLINESILASV